MRVANTLPLLIVLVLVGTPGESAAQFAVTPTLVEVAVRPGAAQQAAFVVTNQGAQQATLEFQRADLGSSPGGNRTFPEPGTLPNGAGLWLSAVSPVLVVPAQDRVKVDFEIRVPPDAKPGSYLGTYVLSRREKGGEGGASKQGIRAGMQVKMRMAMSVHVQVLREDGTPEPSKLRIETVEVAAADPSQPAGIRTRLSNGGLGVFRGDLDYLVRNDARAVVAKGRFPGLSILPGEVVDRVARLDEALAAGKYLVTLVAVGKDGAVVSKDGDLTIGASAVPVVAAPGLKEAPPKAPVPDPTPTPTRAKRRSRKGGD